MTNVKMSSFVFFSFDRSVPRKPRLSRRGQGAQYNETTLPESSPPFRAESFPDMIKFILQFLASAVTEGSIYVLMALVTTFIPFLSENRVLVSFPGRRNPAIEVVCRSKRPEGELVVGVLTGTCPASPALQGGELYYTPCNI